MNQIIVQDRADLKEAPSPEARLASEVLFGESVQVLDQREGWAEVICLRDHYRGFIAEAALLNPGPAPTHGIAKPWTIALAGPDVKMPLLSRPCWGSPIHVADERSGFGFVPHLGWLPMSHLHPWPLSPRDPLKFARQFLGAPYVWGGRTALGLDCSGLIQTIFAAVGHRLPRDSGDQEAALPELAADQRRGGDLVFWRGHVGLLVEDDQVLHANAFHMAVSLEPLAEVIARHDAKGVPLTSYRRP